MDTVTFRLPPDLMQVLERRAKQSKGLSAHQLARHVVIDYLKDTRSQQVTDELIELQNELNRLRDNLASAIKIMLLKAGKINDEREAERWVAKTLY